MDFNRKDARLQRLTRAGSEAPAFQPPDRRGSFVKASRMLYENEEDESESKMDDHHAVDAGNGHRPPAFRESVDGVENLMAMTMTMTPTTQFLEQPELFDVNGHNHLGNGSGLSDDDLLIDLEHKAPSMLWTCVGGALGFVLGTTANIASPSQTVVDWIGMAGTLYMNAMSCLVLPLIFTSTIICMANLVTSRKTKAVMGRMIGYFVFVAFTASLVGLGVGFAFSPSFTKRENEVASSATATVTLQCPNKKFLSTPTGQCNGEQERNALDFIMLNVTGFTIADPAGITTNTTFPAQISNVFGLLFQSNVANAFVTDQFMGITLFGIALGAAFVLAHDEAKSKQNYALILLRQVNLVLEMILNWVIWFTPVCTGSAMASSIINGADSKESVAKAIYFVVATFVALLVHFLLVMCVAYFVLVRKSPLQFMYYMIPTLIVMFSTDNNLATVPVMMRSIEKSRQVSRTLAQFTICIGVSLSLCGKAIFFTTACIFMAYTSDRTSELTAGKVIGLFFVSALSSFGVPQTTGVSLTYVATIWRTIFRTTLPCSFDTLRLVEWLMSRLRRMYNLVVVLFIARIIAEQLDETVEDEEDREYTAEQQLGVSHI